MGKKVERDQEPSEVPNVGPVECWGRVGRPSEGKGMFAMMRPDGWPRSWIWPPNRAGTDTEGSRQYFIGKGGR